ncbi:PREDICTED: uncharacterized protein LOC109243705 [Nicotiana attenuata]|uniref:uncharacterized protein LOC109243705 n=1 Tax=Nicotiana attenuata TaxID=49451 RepID=UPI0009050A90|nr:PREDICTED: uncharacterized protein LOC109243705 [Nicotiana attenuata]
MGSSNGSAGGTTGATLGHPRALPWAGALPRPLPRPLATEGAAPPGSGTCALDVIMKQALGLGIFFSASSSNRLQAFCDADWASCPELNAPLQLPAQMYCDSKSAIQIAANHVFHECTKHIDINCHFIREKVLQGLMETVDLASAKQQADIPTKGLSRHQHHYLLSNLGMKNIFIFPNLRGSVEVLDNCTKVP